MRIVVDIGDEMAWLRESIEQTVERGLSEIESGGRPEYAAGFYAAASTMADAIETRYQAWLQEQRSILRPRPAVGEKR